MSVRETTTYDVIVVGAGPVGLTLINLLGRMGVRCALVERNEEVGLLPKMDLSNPRTMEIFGRMGLAEKIRQAGWPLDAHFDVHVGPSLVDEPYKVLGYPSILEMQAQIVEARDGSMPREPYERISQYNLERLLRGEALELPGVSMLMGRELIGFEDGKEEVLVTVKGKDGKSEQLRSKYLVGCDGGNSRVRSLLNVKLAGRTAVGRMFMIFFRCPELLEKTGLKPFRHFYLAGKRQATLVAQDDLKRWSLHVIIPADLDAATLDPKAEIRASLGVDVETEILYAGAWTPHLLVADRFSVGNVFLAGDAVHQYIPAGGLGMNTGITEADNLGWKLSATLQGWGGRGLLDSYHQERHPIALRNCKASAYAAEGSATWRQLFDPIAMESTPEGVQRRRMIAEAVDRFQRRSHEQRGIELGYRYTASPICVLEMGETSDPDSPDYVPSAAPGARLPHAWIEPSVSVHDRCGPGMSLLAVDADPASIKHFTEVASAWGIPLTIVKLEHRADLQALYGARLLLLRPDLHVAWRADEAGAEEAGSIMATATGRVTHCEVPQ